LLTGSSDADVNEQTKSGMTPLMCAVKVLGPKDGDDGIVSYLLESKANVNLQDVMGDTALHGACWNGHTQAALQLTFRPCHQQVPSVEHNLKTVYASMLNSSVCAMVAPG
jgi:ankyrin repeat protein